MHGQDDNNKAKIILMVEDNEGISLFNLIREMNRTIGLMPSVCEQYVNELNDDGMLHVYRYNVKVYLRGIAKSTIDPRQRVFIVPGHFEEVK